VAGRGLRRPPPILPEEEPMLLSAVILLGLVVPFFADEFVGKNSFCSGILGAMTGKPLLVGTFCNITLSS